MALLLVWPQGNHPLVHRLASEDSPSQLASKRSRSCLAIIAAGPATTSYYLEVEGRRWCRHSTDQGRKATISKILHESGGRLLPTDELSKNRDLWQEKGNFESGQLRLRRHSGRAAFRSVWPTPLQLSTEMPFLHVHGEHDTLLAVSRTSMKIIMQVRSWRRC